MPKFCPFPTFCFALSALFQPAHAFDLAQAWQAALHYSADHAAAKHSRDAEAEQKYQARAALLPQISANAVYQKRNCRYCCIDSYCFSFSIKLPHKNIPSGRGMHI